MTKQYEKKENVHQVLDLTNALLTTISGALDEKKDGEQSISVV